KRVRLFDGTTGKLLNTSNPLPGRISALAFSPDGRVLLAAGGNWTSDRGNYQCFAACFDGETGKRLGPPRDQRDEVRDVAFLEDGSFVPVSGDRWKHRGQLRFFHADGRPRGDPIEMPDDALRVAVSPNGRYLLIGLQEGKKDREGKGREGSALLWD